MVALARKSEKTSTEKPTTPGEKGGATVGEGTVPDLAQSSPSTSAETPRDQGPGQTGPDSKAADQVYIVGLRGALGKFPTSTIGRPC